MRLSSSSSSTSAGFSAQPEEGEENKCLNSELWHACAGPLVSLPHIGSRVVYFPQGHSEQLISTHVAASTNKEVDAAIPSYPGLEPQLICQLHNVTMHADIETDEVYAQMTLQPLTPQEQKDIYLLPSELGGPSKQPTNYFCKTLTASDTSTHGGFSVPRRAAEKVFPPLDYTQTPPAQELLAKDLHGNEWKFKHIFRGQPKRHLLTTGWSVFVSAKRLVAGDSVIFIWNESNQLLLGIRHANRSQTVMPSSVLSSDSMHIGLLAAAAHAASTNSRFTIFYNPRASPSEFVIPLAKYAKAVFHTRVSVGMRFRMLFETEESSVRRYMGTITGISDLDPVRWPNSYWRSVKVGWDESSAGERQLRVSLWEIEPLTTFPMYPSPFFPRLKRPWPSGLPSYPGLRDGDMNPITWFRGGSGDHGMQVLNFQGLGVSPWTQPRLNTSSMFSLQPDIYQALAAATMPENGLSDPLKVANQHLLQFQQSASNVSAPLIQSQMPQQSHSRTNFLQNFLDNDAILSQAQILQQQLQQQQQQQPCIDQSQQQMHLHFQDKCSEKPSTTSSQMEPLSNSHFMSMQAIPPPNQPQSSSNHVSSHVASSSMESFLSSFSRGASSQLVNLQGPNHAVSSSSLSKRVALDPQLPSKIPHFGMPYAEELVTSNSKALDITSLLPPFPGRELSDFQGIDDNLLFGVGMNSSGNLVNGISSNGKDGVWMQQQHSTPNLEGWKNAEQSNAFVKVQMSGSLGRSLDISKFSSYEELRGEVGRMFGLEGVLEDPERSGWQLVFVDGENDVLLLGDDPWQEFVNSVWYIKILSPLEVQQMGKDALHLPNHSQWRRRSTNGNEMPSMGML